MHGMNVCLGKVTNEGVAMDLGYTYYSPDKALQMIEAELVIS